jgi:hypothetical protein
MALCCCSVGKCTPQKREGQPKGEPLKPCVTPDSHELKPAILDPAASQSIPADVDDEFRPRSVSEPHKPGTRLQKPHLKFQTPSLRNIPEETTSNTLQAPLVGASQSVISKTSLSCMSGISDSSSQYHTAPSTGWSSQTLQEDEGHTQPMQIEGNEWERRKLQHNIKPGSESVPPLLTKHLVPQDYTAHLYQPLIKRMEKAEQERMKQHTELMEIISRLTQRVEKLETEKCKEKQVAATPDREGLLETTSHLPQNCSVSTAVLVRLAKRVTQWRFLARRLHIEEHDIQQIGVDFPASIQEQSYQMLLKWKLSLSCNNDAYHTLGEAVREEFGETLYSDYVTMVREAEGSSCQ